MQNFMAGRNGFDSLSVFLLLLAVILNLVARFTGLLIISIFTLVLIALAIWRIFSKNLAKRRAENCRFRNITGDMKDYFSNYRYRRQQKKQYKFFTCPECKSRLRVPRGKGNISVTCPRCGLKFNGKS